MQNLYVFLCKPQDKQTLGRRKYPAPNFTHTHPFSSLHTWVSLSQEHLDCLNSEADEEIFSRLRFIPALCSVPGNMEE